MLSFNVALSTARIVEHIDRGSGTIQYILEDAEILVHNLSHNKDVGFHINVDGIWKDFHASYSHTLLTGGSTAVEVWKVREFGELLKNVVIPTTMPPKPSFQFAVFYHDLDSDTWYWDNNNGQDYFL
ncbi:MAG: hypothetical protein ACU83V_11190 [Gammaproteobacteria bacterium]